jgi:tetratricopeptide (TPR) repeat protein
MNYKELVETCENEIRAGQMVRARRRLAQEVSLKDVPRDWALPVAHVARRTGLIGFAMKLLAPIVRPKKNLSKPATSKERAEYGVLLHRGGAALESLEILETVNLEEAPEALLYRVYCLFNQWDHLAAVPLLQDYLAREQNPYQAMVGELNLCSALVSARRFDEALDTLNRYSARAKEHKLMRLLGNSLELRAQVHLQGGDFSSARRDLQEASSVLSDGKVFDSILVRKWSLITEALEQRSLEPLEKLRLEALSAFAWETVREVDRFKLKIDFRQEAFNHLYFGTPYAMYRKLISEEFKVTPIIRDYTWGGSGNSILDLSTGRIEGLHADTSAMPRKRHMLISILAKDFYQGVRIGGIFSQLFPGEYFDIFSSPQRVRQQIYRTRLWYEENQIPFQIKERQGFYSLAIENNFGIRVTAVDAQADGWRRDWNRVLNELQGESTFGAAFVSERLGVSRSGVKRLLLWALEQGLVVKEGKAANTIYRLVKGPGPAHAQVA